MKLAIHDSDSILNFNCIQNCKKNNIEYVLVDSYSSEIINFVKTEKVTHYFWHFHHILYEDILMARYLLFSLQKMGIKVYPNFNTSWYFDDKVAEKYILETVGAPVVPSWVFYSKKIALNWLRNETKYPLVAKLRRGAGSYNVILLRSYGEAKKYCDKMFSKGINPAPKIFADIKSKFIIANRSNNLISRLKKMPRFFKIMLKARRSFPNEMGYVYFQEFIPGASCDYRIVVVNDKAWGSMRKVRDNDFRASGAGQSYEDPSLIPVSLVKLAFEISDNLDSQSMSYDFVIDSEGYPHIVECSCFFGFDGGDGSFYWDRDLVLHYESFRLSDVILDKLLVD